METAPSPQSSALLLRWAVAFVWLATGVLVVAPFYREEGARYLDKVGLPRWLMCATCAAEVVLGLRVALGRSATWLVLLQVGMILTFSAILAYLQPTLLVSPYGYLSKNLPLIAMIVAAWLLEREGWSTRATWLLRIGVALPWLTEGLLPKVFFQQPDEKVFVGEMGITFIEPGEFLFWLGVAQALSGLLVLTLQGRLLKALLACQLAALIALPIMVTMHHPNQWLHPFGGLTKNMAILAGTWVLFRRIGS
jgi:hypothetical protein